MVPHLVAHFPSLDSVERYWEPFVGGGALFFYLRSHFSTVKEWWLSDVNEDLVNAYQMVRDHVDDLIEELQLHKRLHERSSKEHYYKVRAQRLRSPIRRAGRLLYLNKTCFNGLYRVNSNGQFNVPMGNYANPDICNISKLQRASQALQNVHLVSGDFENVARKFSPSDVDLIYCDPPYYQTFESYGKDGFAHEGHVRLRNAARSWGKRSARVILSNANKPEVKELYVYSVTGGVSDFWLHEVDSTTTIAARPAHRGALRELIITNFATA